MKLKQAACCLAIIAALLPFCNIVCAQSYNSFSKYFGGSGAESFYHKMKVANGEVYLLGGTTSPDVPVTNGSVYRGGRDLLAAKFSATGQLLYASYIGGSGEDVTGSRPFFALPLFEVANGEMYIATTTASPDYPVTNGSAFGGINDVAVTKLDANGNIVFSIYLGGELDDNAGSIFSGNGLVVDNNKVYIGGSTNSLNFPHNIAEYTQRGAYDCFLTVLNANTGAIINSKVVGGRIDDIFRSLAVENGYAYLTIVSDSYNIPITLGEYAPVGISVRGEAYVMKSDGNTLSTVFSRFVGPNIVDYYTTAFKSQVVNGEIHLYGGTSSYNMPVTNGTAPHLAPDLSGPDYLDGFYTRLNADGTIGFSTYLDGDGVDYVDQLKIENGTAYLAGTAYNTQSGAIDINVYRINRNGSFAYTKKMASGRSINNSYYIPGVNLSELNGEVFLSGITFYPEYPITNNSQFYPREGLYGTGYFTRLSNTGNIVYSTFLGRAKNLYHMQYANNKFYMLAQSDRNTYPVTDISTVKGDGDNLLIILNPDGSQYYSGYLGGEAEELPQAMEVLNTDVYISGATSSYTYPVTENTLYKGNTDRYITKFSFCPDKFLLSNDTLRPSTQQVCKNGLGQTIIGQFITVPADSLPLIYRNGTAEKQKPIGCSYQWQSATSPNGPFTNIPNATFRDYTPTTGEANQYFRRLAFRLPQCGGALIHISDTASAIVNNLTAPILNLGGPFITCPGSAIIIGGSPTVSGGNPPYTSYQWDNGLALDANPSASPALNTIYTLTVTDDAGCRQVGQALVNVYRANAGSNKSNCAGNAVKIGGTPISGVPGLAYSWQPAADLSSTSVAQPYANPPVQTDYVLTLTVPKTDGSDCSTRDTVTVVPAAAPLITDFAGPDKVSCLGDTTYIGTPAEAGYNYVWSPGSYLTSNTKPETKYFPGNLYMPNPNPAYINLTAQKGYCYFASQVEVAYIESRAGIENCGPRIVGLPDRTPGINETYSWALVSGPGGFTGRTDLPEVPVSASVGGTSVYGLTVSYKGHSCYSEVAVPPCGGGCRVLFDVNAQYNCPGYDVNFGNVSITARTAIRNPIFTWEPQEGLSNYIGSTVRLTDNIPRTYYATATSADDTSIHCTESINVNDPAFSRPVFDAHDTATCVNQPVTIGSANVAGYTYDWDINSPGLSLYNVSNPVATIPYSASFPVIVSDGNGCSIKDTILVNVENVQAAAGNDWVICNSGVVKLGTLQQPNTSYVWEPQGANWQNSTNQFSAQPEAFVATDISFYVTATTPIGCTVEDTVNVTINNNPSVADAPDVTICKGDEGIIGSPALPGVFYQWSPTTGIADPNAAQATVTATTDITYTLTAIFPGGCALPATDQVYVTVSDAAFDMPDFIFCPANGPVQLGANAPPGMAEYNWVPSFLVSNPATANPTAINPSRVAPTTYILSVTTVSGCKAKDSITIAPAIIPAVAGPDVSMCKNNSASIGSLTNDASPFTTYSWNPTTGLDNPNSAYPVFTATAVGTFTYSLTKISNEPACTSVDAVVIKVDELILPTIASPSVCQNGCVQIGTPPVAGVLYSWLPAAGLSDANIANPLACIGTANTTFNLTANSTSGCTASASVLVTVSNALAAQINIPAVIACTGDTGIHFSPAVMPAEGPYSFVWSPDDGSLSNINLLNPSVFIGSAGYRQYTLQATDTITGCNSSAIASLTVNNCTSLSGIGDYMWFDTDSDGLQDANEIGVSNMSVQLYNSAGIIVATSVTDAYGYYSFASVSPGSYYVVFQIPAGYSFTRQNVGGISALNNSKANTVGQSVSFTVPPGTNVLNIDAGITALCTTPVLLLSFTGRLQTNNTTLLNWQTTAELNNDYFDVERSTDGINFVAIDRVKGKGTTSLPHNYSLVDKKPANGINYYRLRQVDFDGHFVYSNIVMAQLKIKPAVTVVYNSPANAININFTESQNNAVIRLLGDNGQLIKSVPASNIKSYLMQLPVLATGVYILQIINEKMNYTEKVFIRR